MHLDVSTLCLTADATLEAALRCLDATARGIVLVVDGEGRLTATLTDGDIRRAILRGVGRDARIGDWLINLQRGIPPITAPVGTTQDELLTIMRSAGVRHIPVVDAEGRPVDLGSINDVLVGTSDPVSYRALVMAGGKGTRMHPLTQNLPKPMLPIGDRPIIERLMERLRGAGVKNVSVATHHMAERIMEFLGTGEQFGVNIDYLHEETPRGTAGALAMMQRTDEPILVINADILTTVDFRAMMHFHREHDAALTVGVRNVAVEVPYGVIEVDGTDVRSVVEKPTYSYFANAGIYFVEPRVYEMIPHEEKYDMTDLIEQLCLEGEKVVAFPIYEYWRDIGRPEDYASAQQDNTRLAHPGTQR